MLFTSVGWHMVREIRLVLFLYLLKYIWPLACIIHKWNIKYKKNTIRNLKLFTFANFSINWNIFFFSYYFYSTRTSRHANGYITDLTDAHAQIACRQPIAELSQNSQQNGLFSTFQGFEYLVKQEFDFLIRTLKN